MSTVFFTADPHFGHTNIIRYENRPFASAEEMDQELIRRWNETVSPEDTVYLLGDFSFYRKEKPRDPLRSQGHMPSGHGQPLTPQHPMVPGLRL